MRTVVLPGLVARLAVALVAVCAGSSLTACTQDEASSNPNDRDTHMGDIHAAQPVAPASAPAPGTPAPGASH
jgi:hypothetical protein